MMELRRGKPKDLPVIAKLACGLWPEHTAEAMERELAEILGKPDAAVFLVFWEETAVGFAQSQLRRDYVEGTDSSPVGYLEGIYVVPEHRRCGLGKLLLGACESWAKALGCREFASDCELTNGESLPFHLKVGFEEANRIICFVKSI